MIEDKIHNGNYKGNERSMKLPESEFEKYTEYLKYPFPHVIYYEYLIDRLIARMDLPPDASFLDIGCGTGSLLVKMGSRGYKGIGIDLEDLSVQISKRRVSKFEIEVYQLDLFDLHGSFDVIFANSVLEHIENDGEALSKIRNLLKPEGYFLFEVPGNMKLFGDHDRALGHFRRYEKNDLIHKIEEAGLEIVIFGHTGSPFCLVFIDY
jgi:2-polyprenyl-3-methyl-5-hydroxy-6-metoxy-1,4-benzoquinol methylase